MQLDKKDAATVNKAIDQWQNDGLLNDATSSQLRQSIETTGNNSTILATYALIASVSCGLLAFGALVLDEKWIELLRKRLGFSEIVVGAAFLLLSVLLTIYSKRTSRKYGLKPTNEAFNITIVLSLGVAMAYIGKSLAFANNNFSILLLGTATLYFMAASYLKSKAIWISGIFCLTGWWAAQTYFWSKGSDYFLGMNYALRMTVFAFAMLSLSWFLFRIKPLLVFQNTTNSVAWLMVFTASWTLSILGNSSSMQVWFDIRQGSLWYWALGYTFFLIVVLYYSIVKNNNTLRDITLVFILLNIYTRYFEYFWDKTNKGLFFAILAVSFWWLSRLADKWRVKQSKTNNLSEKTG